MPDIVETIQVMAERRNGPHRMPCNWFQIHKNVMDPAHVGVLHKEQFPPK
jgi:phenylpropionate dioxygenase-like ring-hydroxylating dioxygenase large terminal subunit